MKEKAAALAKRRAALEEEKAMAKDLPDGVAKDSALSGVEDAIKSLDDEANRQSEDESEVAHWITSDAAHCQALIVNPSGGPSATSADYQVVLDALAHLDKPVVEVHLTNIFRTHRKPLQGLSGSAGFVCGLGVGSYLLAIAAVAQQLGVVRAE